MASAVCNNPVVHAYAESACGNCGHPLSWHKTDVYRVIPKARQMKASEIIEKVQAIIDEHGDLEVYSYCDDEYVQSVEYQEDGAMGTGNSGPVILLS